MAGDNPFINNPGYIQAMKQGAIAEARCQEQQQCLNQFVNNYIANLSPEQNDLAIGLLRCGLDTPLMLYAFLQEGFQGLCDLRTVMLKDLTEMAMCISHKPSSEGPVNIGMILLKQIEALSFWVKSKLICGEPLVATAFTQDVLDEVQANMMATESQKGAEDEIASKSYPGKLQSDNLKWVNWKKQLINHLFNICNTHGVRLVYIVRKLLLKPLQPNHQFVNEDEHLIWSAVHVGPDFQVDNTNLFQITKRCCIGTNGATWIHQASNAKDGFMAVDAQCQQFNGRTKTQNLCKTTVADLALLQQKDLHEVRLLCSMP